MIERGQVKAGRERSSGIVGPWVFCSMLPGYLVSFRPSGQLRSSRNLVKHTLWAVQTRIGSVG